MIKEGDLRKKVLIDLFAAPIAVIPAAIGVSMMVLGWAFGAGFISFAGFPILLSGVGVGATRFFLFKGKIIDEAFKALDKLQEKEKNKELDALDRKLTKDRDSRTQGALRDMRVLYRHFHEQLQDKSIKADYKVIENVEFLFDRCIAHLSETLVLNKNISRMSSKEAKSTLREAREQLVVEVQDTVNRLSTIMDGLRQLTIKPNTEELERVTAELEQGLEINRRIDEEISNAGRNDYSWLREKLSKK